MEDNKTSAIIYQSSLNFIEPPETSFTQFSFGNCNVNNHLCSTSTDFGTFDEHTLPPEAFTPDSDAGRSTSPSSFNTSGQSTDESITSADIPFNMLSIPPSEDSFSELQSLTSGDPNQLSSILHSLTENSTYDQLGQEISGSDLLSVFESIDDESSSNYHINELDFLPSSNCLPQNCNTQHYPTPSIVLDNEVRFPNGSPRAFDFSDDGFQSFIFSPEQDDVSSRNNSFLLVPETSLAHCTSSIENKSLTPSMEAISIPSPLSPPATNYLTSSPQPSGTSPTGTEEVHPISSPSLFLCQTTNSANENQTQVSINVKGESSAVSVFA